MSNRHKQSLPFLGGSELISLSRLLFRAYLDASEQRREVLVVLKLVERIVVALGLDDRHEQIAVFVARHREAHAYAVPVDIAYACLLYTSRVVYKEKLTTKRIIGIVISLAGVVLVGLV